MARKEHKWGLRLLAGSGALICGLLAPVIAVADANLNCSAYAGVAVSHNEQNLSLGCGFTGPRWTSDFAAHFGWCQQPTTKMSNLTSEDRERLAALAECAQRPQRAQQACQTYAQGAVTAARQANETGCGFSGRRWLTDYAQHFNWCLTAPQAARDQETAARGNQLQGCIAAQRAASAAEQGSPRRVCTTEHRVIPLPPFFEAVTTCRNEP